MSFFFFFAYFCLHFGKFVLLYCTCATSFSHCTHRQLSLYYSEMKNDEDSWALSAVIGSVFISFLSDLWTVIHNGHQR